MTAVRGCGGGGIVWDLTWLSCSVSSQPSRAKHTVSLHWGHTQTRSRIVCTTEGEKSWEGEKDAMWKDVAGKQSAFNCDKWRSCLLTALFVCICRRVSVGLSCTRGDVILFEAEQPSKDLQTSVTVASCDTTWMQAKTRENRWWIILTKHREAISFFKDYYLVVF